MLMNRGPPRQRPIIGAKSSGKVTQKYGRVWESFYIFLLTNNERSLYILIMISETKAAKTKTCEA
jgi:hypothetical protein